MPEFDKAQPIMIIDSEDAWLDQEVKKKVWTGPFDQAVNFVDAIYNWGRRSSIWPMQFGLACCAIEMICAGGGRYDIARFGAELFRPSPRQADLMIVAGTVTKKMVPAIVRLYNQMAEPKYVLAMGACASAGGPFKEGYNVVSGIDKFLPVDVYVPGCPPTPQALLFGLITLQKKIDAQSVRAVPWYQAEMHAAIPEPVYGPDLFDPRRAEEIKTLAADPEKQEALYFHIAARAEVKHGKKEGEAEKPAPGAARPAPAPKPAATKSEGAPPAAKTAATAGSAPGNPRAVKGLPTATPENEAKLAELKADADFAAHAEQIHETLAKGGAGANAEARTIEEADQAAVRARLSQAGPSGGVVETEPNAGESKEATKKFQSEIGERDRSRHGNPGSESGGAAGQPGPTGDKQG